MNFYTRFNYEDNFTFDEYFNQNLINLCSNYGVYVKKMNQFKIFCYSFYFQLTIEIKKANYSNIQKLYNYYNPDSNDVFEEKELNNNLQMQYSNKNILMNIFKSYNRLKEQSIETFYQLNNLVNSHFIVPLMISTETVVDMVLSVINNS